MKIRMNLKNTINSDPAKTLSLRKSRFTEMLVEENASDLRGFDRWILCNGMLFSSPDKWWGDHGQRDFPHEGIDLCLYKDSSRRIRTLDKKIQIPVMHDGTVRAMFKDYLGKAVVVEHQDPATDTGRYISFYAHTNPGVNIDVGMHLKAGDIIATLADTSNSKARILPHLHFSLGLPSKSFSYDGFVWNRIRKPEMMTLLDPLPVIDWPYQMLEAGDPICSEL